MRLLTNGALARLAALVALLVVAPAWGEGPLTDDLFDSSPALVADGESGDYCAEPLWPACDMCLSRGLYAFVGYDSFRGIADGNWQNNGIHTGVNYGTRLGQFSDLTGIGFQLGGSVGVYDWSGSNDRLSRQDQAQTQGFVTYGFFHKPSDNCPFTAAVAQDLMVNSNYGVFAENPTLGQWRGQLGYALNPWHDVGIWATWRGWGDTRNVNGVGPVTWRPVQQLNKYWHHNCPAISRTVCVG